MKHLRLSVLLFLAPLAPLALTSCQTPPSQRVVQVQTLKAVGHAAESTVALSAQLYRDGRITAEQARQVMEFYDRRFQPVFRAACTAVNAHLDSVASPELGDLATQLAALLESFTRKTPTP